MSKGRDTLSHIDGTHYELWVPKTLGIKGEGTKPQEFDTSKVAPVLDMGQGGFAYDGQAQAAGGAAALIAGVDEYYYHTGVSCLFGAGGSPQNAPKNESPFHARILRSLIDITVTQASAPTMSGRYIEYRFGVKDDGGSYHWLEAGHWFGSSQIQHYFAEIDETIIVLPGFEFVAFVRFQPDWSGGAGPAVFPAGTIVGVTVQYYKKPFGGQLPI